MACASCQSELPPDVAFCTACGTPVPAMDVSADLLDELSPLLDVNALHTPFAPPLVRCESCGHVSSAVAYFCISCGVPLSRDLGQGGVDPGDERRTATLLNADVVGFTRISEVLPPEDVRSLMNAIFTALTREIVAQGGVVDKFVGDAVLAVFGVPCSHGDDPRRAVEAALSMHEALEMVAHRLPGTPLQVRIGIETGEVVVGRVAGGNKPTVTGTPVAAAMALEAAAPPGATLIGEETWRQVRDHYRLMSHNSPRLDRTSWRVVGRLTGELSAIAVGAEPPLVGRDLELARLGALLEIAIDSTRVEVVTLSGPPGIGKSRLVREWVRMVTDRKHPRVLAYTGDCSAFGTGGHIDLLSQWLRAMAGGGSGVTLGRMDVAQLVGRTVEVANRGQQTEREEMTDLICHLLDIDIAVGPWFAPILRDPAQLRHRTVGAVASLLAALARRVPLVLVGEDYHLARPSAREFLEQVLNLVGDAPILFMRVMRQELNNPEGVAESGPGERHEIRLAPLGRGAVVALLQSAVGENLERVSRVAPMLAEMTEGNPLFLLEIIRDLRELDMLGAVFSGEGDVSEQLPASLRRLVQARLDRLPPEEKRLVRSASVIGMSFWDELLERMGCPNPARALSALENKGLIRRRRFSRVSGSSEYSFTSVMLRDVAYENVLLRMRRFHHLVVASWLEERLDMRRAEFGEAIAYHLFHGGQKVRAGRYLMTAAERARSLYSLDDARVLFGRAEELLQGENEPEALQAMAQLQESMGVLEEARTRVGPAVSRYQAALSLREVLTGVEHQISCGRLELRLGELNTSLGHIDVGMEMFHRAQARVNSELAELTEGRCLYADVCKARGWALLRTGRREECRVEFEKGLARITTQTVEERMIAARLQSAMGMLDRILGQPMEALERHRRALQLARTTENLELRCICLVNWAAVLVDLRQFDQARACYEEALDVQRRIGKTIDVAMSLTNLAAVALEQGYDDQVRTCTAEALAYLEPHGDHWSLPELYRVLAELHLKRSESREARTFVTRMLITAERLHIDHFQGIAYRLLAQIDLVDGLSQMALDHLSEARRRSEQAGDPREWARIVLLQSRLALGQGLKDYTTHRTDLMGVQERLAPYPDEPMMEDARIILQQMEVV